MQSPGQLFDAAVQAQDEGIRFELQLIHSEITEAVAKFLDDPCTANLRILNGHWSHGTNMLKVAARKGREKRFGR